MTTRTAAPTRNTKTQSRPVSKTWSNRQKKADMLGLSSMEELRHVERIERGTAAQRQQPRKRDADLVEHAAYVGKDKQSFLEPLWAFIDKEIGSETAFPKDGDRDVLIKHGKQDKHVFGVDESITVSLAGHNYPVKVLSCFEASTRLRYRIAFENGAEMALTQAILVKIRVLPAVTLAPTHLLPAVCPQPQKPVQPRICYHGFVVEGEAVPRVLERLANHWSRQINKLAAPFNCELPRVIAV